MTVIDPSSSMQDSMQQLINFSVYPPDTERFENDWEAIAAYIRSLDDIAGIELLLSYEPPPATPTGLVRAVHLPYWVTWLDVWRDEPTAVSRYYPGIDPRKLSRYCGGRNSAEIIETQRRLWLHAATLGPAYAVLHISHVELIHTVTREYSYTDLEVVDAMAEMLNAVAATFEGGEPPVRLFLENLWWPGLTFTTQEPAEQLAEQLHFDNWAFMLDTGHLMNTNLDLVTENQSIDYVVQIIENLSPPIRERIEGLHFHCSLSGAYQRAQIKSGLPADFHHLNLVEQRSLARDHVLKIDQHRPFTQPRCREIIEAVRPHFLTHEFLSTTQAEFDQKLTLQQAALRGPATLPHGVATHVPQ